MAGLTEELIEQLSSALNPVDGEAEANPALAQLRAQGEHWLNNYIHASAGLEQQQIAIAHQTPNPPQKLRIACHQERLLLGMNNALTQLQRIVPEWRPQTKLWRR